jgi:hypothetical protein
MRDWQKLFKIQMFWTTLSLKSPESYHKKKKTKTRCQMRHQPRCVSAVLICILTEKACVFRTNSYSLAGGTAVMASETIFIVSILSLQCILLWQFLRSMPNLFMYVLLCHLCVLWRKAAGLCWMLASPVTPRQAKYHYVLRDLTFLVGEGFT